MRVVYVGNLSDEGGDTFGPESSVEGGVERPLSQMRVVNGT